MTAPPPPSLSQGLAPAMLHHAVALRHVSDAAIQLPSESVEEEENDTFFASMETRKKSEPQMGFEGSNPI